MVVSWCFPTRGFSQILLKIDKFDVKAANLQLNGNCRIMDNILRITSSAPVQAGACWFKQQMPLKNGFETEFTFKIWENDLVEKGGDVPAALVAWEPEQLVVGKAFVERNREMGRRSLVENNFDPAAPSTQPGLYGPGR